MRGGVGTRTSRGDPLRNQFANRRYRYDVVALTSRLKLASLHKTQSDSSAIGALCRGDVAPCIWTPNNRRTRDLKKRFANLVRKPLDSRSYERRFGDRALEAARRNEAVIEDLLRLFRR